MKLDWIQGLRGVAVLMVVLTHGRYFLNGTPNEDLAFQLFYPAAMGVDLFFLISGFIMVYTTRHASGVRDAAMFAVKRFARIWPAFAVITLAWIFLANGRFAFFHDPHNLDALFRTLTFRPVDGTKAPFFGLVFPLGWTLAFEMYFYIVFGLSMLAGRLRWFVLASWALLSLVLLPALYGGPTLDVQQHLGYESSYMQLVSNPIIYEFLAGVAIGLLYLSPRVRFPSASVAWQAVVCSIGFALWWGWTGFGRFHGPAGWGFALSLMLCALALASKTVTLAVPRWLVWVGTVSYSMYLTHHLGQIWLQRWLERHAMRTQSWNEIFLMLLLAIPLAALSHALLERGLGESLRKWLVRAVDRCFKGRVESAPPEVIKMANEMPKIASRSM
jgi:peptidoglycan/LPS O-acetylase OafA/YrhL